MPPLEGHQASTVFLRVPVAEWAAVKNGLKREFRVAGGNVSQVWNLGPLCPVPVVAYSVSSRGHDTKLMVLDRCWQEQLREISQESLREERCKTFAEFRRKWMRREKKRFRPTRKVWVFRVRPWNPDDRGVFADRLFVRLYGAYE